MYPMANQLGLHPLSCKYEDYEDYAILPNNADAYTSLHSLTTFEPFKKYAHTFIPIRSHSPDTWGYNKAWEIYRHIILKESCCPSNLEGSCTHWLTRSYKKGDKPFNPPLQRPILLDETCASCKNNKKNNWQEIGIELHPSIVHLEEMPLKYVLAQLLTHDDLIFNIQDSTYTGYATQIKKERAQCKKGIRYISFYGQTVFVPLYKIAWGMAISAATLVLVRTMLYYDLHYTDGCLGLLAACFAAMGDRDYYNRSQANTIILKNNIEKEKYLHYATVNRFAQKEHAAIKKAALECYNVERQLYNSSHMRGGDIYGIPNMRLKVSEAMLNLLLKDNE